MSTLHVLVTDDEPDVLELLSELLLQEGYWVTTSTELLGIDQVKQLSPDVIILDLIFDGVALGLGFLTSIREDAEIGDLPVIICSGATFLLDSAGIKCPSTNLEMVEKPFDLDDVVSAIDRCLQISPTKLPT